MEERPLLPRPGASSEELADWERGAKARRASDLAYAERLNRQIWRGGLLRIAILEWSAVALMLWSVHTTSLTAGTIAFWSAIGLGDGGFLFLLVLTWRKAERGSGW